MPADPAVATKTGHKIPIAINDFRGFIANVLATLGWRDIQTPRDFKVITAAQRDEARGHAVWVFDYKLKIKYRKATDSKTILDYEVSEEKQRLKQKCQDKLDKLVEAVQSFAADAVETASEQEVPVTYGDAKFADEKELRQKDYITSDVPANRLLLAPWGNEYLTVPVPFTNMHGLVCGPTGSGKSSGFFVPNLVFRTGTSVIVTEATAGDETPELFANTAGWRQFKQNKVYFFNPDCAKGTRINPIDRLKQASSAEFALVADELANLVIINTTPPTTTRQDPIWDKSEKHLLWIMIMHVASAEDPKKAHFGAIREILRKSDKQIRLILKESQSRIAGEEYDSFLNHSSDNFRHGVFAGLLQRLNPWLSSVVQTMTSSTDLDLKELANQKFSFYISTPSRKTHLKPIAALIFNFILDLSLSTKFKYPPAMMLDEFTNFGAIPEIDSALSIIRKRNLPVVLGFQTQSQLIKLYGQTIANDITSQLSTRIFFRPRNPRDAEVLSDALDYTTILEKKTDDRGHTMVREVGRPLMSVRQIATLAPTEVIIMTESTNPIKTTRFDHVSCPAPSGFDPPELQQHELIRVEQLNDSDLAAEAKTAKQRAEQDLEFGTVSKEVEDVIVAAEERYRSRTTSKAKTEPGPKPAPEPKKVTNSEEKRKRAKPPKEDPNDDWDIPG